jgi:hypothetical protein
MIRFTWTALSVALTLALLPPRSAVAADYFDPNSRLVAPVVLLSGCTQTGVNWSCAGPVTASNPLAVSASVSATVNGFAPGGVYATPLTVGATSSRVALPSGTTVMIYNVGSNGAYVALGNPGVVAAASDDYVPAGGCLPLTVGANVDLAAIETAGATTLNLSGGTGLGICSGGGGGGSGSVPTGSAGSPNAAVLSVQGISGGFALPVSGTFWQATQPVSGTFWQATQPVSIASMPSTPVTGTFWQATQPVSIASMPSTPVTGTFWPAVQAVSVPADTAPATQNVTVIDSGSTTTAWSNGQSAVTGTPTAGSAATFTLAGVQTGALQASGTWTGTLAVEVSADGGTTWFARGVYQPGAAVGENNFTGNFLGEINLSGFTGVRVRATAAMTGTATVLLNKSFATLQQVHVSGGAVSPAAASLGGSTAYSEIVPANTTGISIKGSAGTVYGLPSLTNNGTAPLYVKLYNTASAPTCGSGTPVLRFEIPVNASTAADGAGSNPVISAVGIAFSAGIGMCVTGGIADADTTTPTASVAIVNVNFN